MKSKSQLLALARAIQAIILAFLIISAGTVKGATIWTGPDTNFTQSASSLTDVLIPGAVSLTRARAQWLFNPAAGDTGPGTDTPTDTEWAFGELANYAALDYQTFASYRNGDLSALLVGNPMVVHLITEDVYLSLTFSAWPQHGGFFAYTRSTPPAAAPVPSVTITDPAGGAVFAAPASVQMGAAATVASGSVTNVAFFTNGILSGDSQAAPFSITASNLAPGSYALTAVATAGGVSATSSVVSISIVSPAPTSLTAPMLTNNQFAFDYSANAGLGYVVQSSSNLIDWMSVVTNVAASNLVTFTNVLVPNGAQYFRVGRLPNP